ncbi:MAG: NAD(P)H-binding protein [Alphaproteobacteria bacterium]
MNKVLVLAANGNVGKHLVNALLVQGAHVKAATRNGQNINEAEGVVFDFNDMSTWENALKDVKSAYVMLPMGYNDKQALTKFLDMLLALNIKIVLQGSVEHYDTPKNMYYAAEQQLKQSGKTYVILRPTWFMDNFKILWQQDLRNHKLQLPLQYGKSALIDARDIADCGVQALLSHQFDNQAFNLTGGELLTYAEAIEIIAENTQLPITFEYASPQKYRLLLQEQGMPDATINFFLGILQEIEDGVTEVTTDGVQTLTGNQPRKLANYAKDNAQLWQK